RSRYIGNLWRAVARVGPKWIADENGPGREDIDQRLIAWSGDAGRLGGGGSALFGRRGRVVQQQRRQRGRRQSVRAAPRFRGRTGERRQRRKWRRCRWGRRRADGKS